MDRAELEEGARKILLTNLRQGVADWNGQEYSFVCPSLTGYPFQWFWDSCFHAIALIHLDPGQAKAELRTLMRAALPNGWNSRHPLSPKGEASRWTDLGAQVNNSDSVLPIPVGASSLLEG